MDLTVRALDLTGYAYNSYALLQLACALFVLTMGAVIVVRERGSHVGVIYFFDTLAIAVWFMAFSAGYVASDAAAADVWFRLGNIGVAFIPTLTLQFTWNLLRPPNRLQWLLAAGWVASVAFALAFTMLPGAFEAPYRYSWGYYGQYNVHGTLLIPFLALFFGMSLLLYWQAYKRARPGSNAAQRAKLLFIAWSIGSFGAVDFLPFYGIDIYPFGFLIVVVGVSVLTYVTARYRLEITPAFVAQHILQHMNDGLFVLDEDGVVRVANSTWLGMIGATKEEFIGKPVPQSLRRLLSPSELASIEYGSPMRDREIETAKPDGSPLVLSVGVSTMRAAGVENAAYVVVVRDITESFAARRQQLELNHQLRAALEQAEAASRAKTRFLASASHDLRQPIHTLSLFGAALDMRPLDPASREIAQHMNTALQVLANQLDALLDISKLDAQVVKVNVTSVKLANMLQRIWKEFGPTADAKGLKMALRCPRDATVETDPLLLERIVRNLLDNAIKYTDAGCISLQVTREGDASFIELSDSGRGIPQAEQRRIFEEFYQLDNPERDRTKGLGLGLAIVRRLADLLRIQMEMRSAEGTGTTFILKLRAATPPSAAASAPPPQVAVTPAQLHVLVIDDEAAVRVGMKTLLEGMGWRTTVTDCIEQALAAAKADKPDLVLSDLRLRGDSSGIEAICAIRKLFPDMPAILISGDIAPERLQEAEAAGIPLLHKPVPVETLKQVIMRKGLA